MPFEHPSGIPGSYDRVSGSTNPDAARARLVFPEGAYLQGADLNEMQTLQERARRRVGNMVAADGDRIERADIFLDYSNGNAQLSAGLIYVAGDVRVIAAATINALPASGEITIGVRLRRIQVTADDDPTLLGLHPGTDSEGEPGAAREREIITWATAADGQPGDYYPVYLIRDRVVIDQKAPPSLTGVQAEIARYDRDALGSYIVEGCEVKALGKIGSAQRFSVASGIANIFGFKRTRFAAILHDETEAPDLETITAEPITMTGSTGGPHVLTVARPPINDVIAAVIVKRVTEVVTRGAIAGGSDPLQFSSVVAVESVVQGGTTYVATTDYVRSGGSISWAPAGAEPAGASTYSVTYLYNASTTPTAVNDTTVTVADGGVNGQLAQITYRSKVPRTDCLCLDEIGGAVMIKGISARLNRLAPLIPTNLLKLAEVDNLWSGLPVVTNNGTRRYQFDDQKRFFDRLVTVLDQFERANAERDILTREPVSKNGIFTDSFVDDFYRDQGAAQTAAINNGVLELAIDDVDRITIGSTVESLPFTEEVVVSQRAATSSILINPYMTYRVMPGSMRLEPPAYFWTDAATVFTSGVTQQLAGVRGVPGGTTIIEEMRGLRQATSETIRPISLQITLGGFAANENLATLTFAGLNIKPAGTQTADSNGQIVVTVTIPSGVPAGAVSVRATGAAGSWAGALFIGQGDVVAQDILRTLVVRADPPPDPPAPQPPPAVIRLEDWFAFSGTVMDPVAQTFALAADRLVIGVNIRLAALGDRTKPIRVQLRNSVNGFPGPVVSGEGLITLATANVGDTLQARFAAPVHLRAATEYCFVVLTEDLSHAVSIARMGDVDPVTQQRVAAQPWVTGVLFTSSNNRSWTAQQDADMWFEIVAANFTGTTRTINLWTGAVANITDMLIRGVVDLPSSETRFRYEIVRADNSIIRAQPGQKVQLPAGITETISVRAVFEGTARVAPTLYPGSLLILGRLRSSGTYITRQFPMGSNVTIRSVMALLLPAGSSVTVECDAGNGTFVPLTAGTSVSLGSNWNETTYTRNAYTAANGRVRITLNGSAGARPAAARLRAYSL
jgi:hypothetical protein